MQALFLICRIRAKADFRGDVHGGLVVRRRARHVDPRISRTSSAIARPRGPSSTDLIATVHPALRLLAADAWLRVACGHNAGLCAGVEFARSQSARKGGGFAPEAAGHCAEGGRWPKRRAEASEANRASADREAAAAIGRQHWAVGDAAQQQCGRCQLEPPRPYRLPDAGNGRGCQSANHA